MLTIRVYILSGFYTLRRIKALSKKLSFGLIKNRRLFKNKKLHIKSVNILTIKIKYIFIRFLHFMSYKSFEKKNCLLV
jgi:hypothetical protein